jgi:CBS domain-containing protein
MKKREPVSKIMTAQVVSVDVDTHLREVINTMKKGKFRHMPISKGNSLVGIISKSDLNRLTFSSLFEGQAEADEAILDMLTLETVMSSNPKTVNTDTPIKDVAEIFTTEDFHALPVVDENNKIAGIVTTTDVIKYLLELY